MIDAIQHIAYRIACKGAVVRKRVVVDAAGYRERRAVALRAAADQAAEAAVHDQRAVTLEAMTALERKVVHEHLKSLTTSRRTARARSPIDGSWWRRSSTDGGGAPAAPCGPRGPRGPRGPGPRSVLDLAPPWGLFQQSPAPTVSRFFTR